MEPSAGRVSGTVAFPHPKDEAKTEADEPARGCDGGTPCVPGAADGLPFPSEELAPFAVCQLGASVLFTIANGL